MVIMRNVCLVTNYNYDMYLEACLDSLASQSRQFDQIIIVDDGSSDGSVEIINRFCRDYDYAMPLFKNNGGQLSCFSAALEFIKPDDFVFFMDADDIYPPDYLERVSPFIAGQKADFIFVDPVQFRDAEQPLKSAVIGAEKSFEFASTSALTRKTYCWIGAATSCISMKGSLFRTLLPYPFEKDWVTRADDVLIYGASITGSHKLYIPSLGIGYRIHGANSFTGRELSPNERADWRVRHERLFKWYSDKSGLPDRPPVKNVLHEVALLPQSIRKRFGIPSQMVLFLYNILLLVPILRLLCKNMTGSKG
ncbi:MAG: glycosyltransferase [Deltaproteobacteria bacterium]